MDAFECEQADKAILRRLGLAKEPVHVDEDGLGWIEVEPGSFVVVEVNNDGAERREGGTTMTGATLSKKDQASGKSRKAEEKQAAAKQAETEAGEHSADPKAAAKAADAKSRATSSAPKSKKVSAREAAIRVLKNAGEPMSSKDIIEKASKIATDLKDPHAIQVALVTGNKKGKDFKRVEKGVYALIEG